MDTGFWDVLHDGKVVAASGAVPGDLRLSIRIAYLCGHLPTGADHVSVTLAACERLEYRPYQEPPVPGPAAIASLGLVLLSAELVNGSVSVECADGGYGGQLLLRYSSAHAATAEGRPLSQPDLESAAARYWSRRRQRHA